MIADGVEVDESGDGFATTTDEPAVLIVNCPADQKPYVVEDFPDPEADDFPGTWVVAEPPKQTEILETHAPEGDEGQGEEAQEQPNSDDDIFAAAAGEVEEEDAQKEQDDKEK